MTNKKFKISLLAILFLVLPLFVSADYGGQKTSFFVDPSYDLQKRAQLTATLLRITPSLYFYLDDVWWDSLSSQDQQEVKVAIQNLGDEFSERIYPILTDTFGKEWNPGIDNDWHITVLLHPMNENAGGYVNTADEYSRLQNIFSNQREMVYLNSRYLGTSLMKSFLAHEFSHLITFNQKEKRTGNSEEIWLNELRAEYIPTLLGYNDDYINSILKKRVNVFLQYPNDSLTEWKIEKIDYGVINLFAQYLVGHYGIEILTDSLKSRKVGIPSINEALLSNGFSEDFAQIFTDWTIANIVNDCSLGDKYCYKNTNLKNIKIIPNINFLPLKGKSTFASTQEAKDWAGNWYKFIGGRGDLKIEFVGFADVKFRVPYIIEDSSGKKQVKFLELSDFQRGKVIIEDFGDKINSVVIIPSLQSKTSDFDGAEKSYPFFWSASTEVKEQSNNQESEESNHTNQTEEVQVLLEKISFLEKQLLVLKEELKVVLGEEQEIIGTQTLTKSLRQGDREDEVKILQEWLSQDKTVYPEGFVTGYFGVLTRAAVIRFQEKYADDVLLPWRLEQGTGFVGATTRAKLNELYGK